MILEKPRQIKIRLYRSDFQPGPGDHKNPERPDHPREPIIFPAPSGIIPGGLTGGPEKKDSNHLQNRPQPPGKGRHIIPEQINRHKHLTSNFSTPAKKIQPKSGDEYYPARSSAIRSAARVANAIMVSWGFTPMLSGTALPSTTNRPGTE